MEQCVPLPRCEDPGCPASMHGTARGQNFEPSHTRQAGPEDSLNTPLRGEQPGFDAAISKESNSKTEKSGMQAVLRGAVLLDDHETVTAL